MAADTARLSSKVQLIFAIIKTRRDVVLNGFGLSATYQAPWHLSGVDSIFVSNNAPTYCRNVAVGFLD